MKKLAENSEKAVQYLFGELGGAERDAIEERLFTDEEFSLFLDAVENDLIDEYVRGEMNFVEKQRFEEKYLISERRREKVRVANILEQKVFVEKAENITVAAVPKISVWQTLADVFRIPNLVWAGGLAAILLMILLGGWLFLQQTRPTQEVVKEQNSNLPLELPTPEIAPPDSPTIQNETNGNKPSDIEKKSSAEKPSPTKSEPQKPQKPDTISPKPQPRVFAFTLLPPMRSGERPVLNVPQTVQTISLRVVHDNQQSFIKYRAEIRDPNGDLIWSREIPVSEKTLARPISLNVRNAALASGSYELTLSGITADNQLEEIKFYNFTVQKK